MIPNFDNEPRAGEPLPQVAPVGQSAGEALEAELANLNRRLRELTDDLTSLGAPTPAPSAATQPTGAHSPQPPVSATTDMLGEADRRAAEIIAAAQRTADEILASAHQQAVAARAQISSLRETLAQTERQAERARKSALGELLLVGEQLLGSARRVLGGLENGPTPMAEGAPAPAPMQASAPASVVQHAPSRPLVIDERAPLAHHGEPQPYVQRAGVYQTVLASEPITPLPSRPAPAAPIVHLGKVTLTAGPLVDVASAAALERAVERIPGVGGSRVKRFVEGRVSIELQLTNAVVLAEELGRVLPYPFEVQAAMASEIDILLGSTLDQDAAANDRVDAY